MKHEHSVGPLDKQLDQDRLLSALEKQLDQAETVLNTFVAIAVIALFAGISGADPIKAGGFEVPRKQAFIVLGLLFIFANATMLILFLRVGDLVRLLDGTSLPKGLAALGLHKWLFNPFSFFGEGILARIYSGTGFGCCIVMWWVGFSALQAVRPDHGRTDLLIYNGLTGIYLAVGLLSMLAVNRGFSIILQTASKDNSDMVAVLKHTAVERTIFTFAGIAFGGLVSFVTGAFQFLEAGP